VPLTTGRERFKENVPAWGALIEVRYWLVEGGINQFISTVLLVGQLPPMSVKDAGELEAQLGNNWM
jgi:hypothetical protein